MAIKPEDFKPAVIIDCQTKQITMVELTPEQKQEKIASASENEAKEMAEKDKAVKRAEALAKLKLDPKNNDLLIALGLMEPETKSG